MIRVNENESAFSTFMSFSQESTTKFEIIPIKLLNAKSIDWGPDRSVSIVYIVTFTALV